MNPLKRIEQLEKQVAELLAHLPMLEEMKAEYERFKADRLARETVHKNDNLSVASGKEQNSDPTPQKGERPQ